MIKPNVRALMETHLEMARDTESAEVAEVHLNIAQGFIEYAMENGDINAVQFGTELTVIKLVRQRRKAKVCRA